MKLIIDIPDKVYNEYREGVMSMGNNCIIGNAVFDGIPYEERPQGEWIAREPYTHETFCPFCKEDTKDEVYGNFCPNCGADMRGGAEHE